MRHGSRRVRSTEQKDIETLREAAVSVLINVWLKRFTFVRDCARYGRKKGSISGHWTGWKPLIRRTALLSEICLWRHICRDVPLD